MGSLVFLFLVLVGGRVIENRREGFWRLEFFLGIVFCKVLLIV